MIPSTLNSFLFTGYPSDSDIVFKILVLVYKSLHQQTPNYISAMLHVKTVQRRLRSTSSSPLFTELRTQTTFADKSFSCYAPHLWNQLPVLMKTTVSVESFKKLLKHHLFELAYDQWLLFILYIFCISFMFACTQGLSTNLLWF